MISTVLEFDESTAFERWALDALVPLPSTRPHSAVEDIERNLRVMLETAVMRLHAGGIRKVYVDLRPLAFGAGWKVLDLLMEVSLSLAGRGGGGRMAIGEKIEKARHGAGVCPPLSQDAELWGTLTDLYAASAEIRHSLVHRLAEVDRVTGQLTGRDERGRPLTPITADHQEAFCRAVQRAAQAALAQSIRRRERSDLAWNLDQLRHLHGRPPLGGHQMQPAALKIAPTKTRGDRLLVDVPTLLDELRFRFPGRSAYDASFTLPDGQHLLAELEQAPPAEVEVDPAKLPEWIQPWEGPG